MKHMFFSACLLMAAGHAIAQEAAKIQPRSHERYISYVNTPANRLLFDRADPNGFYTVLQATITEIARSGDSGLRGIAPEYVSRVKKASSYALGEQVTVPLTGRDGKDSVIHHPDGIEEYVYPVRDTIWNGIDYIWGEQKTIPISNYQGKDSVIYLADGTTEYVYPAREMVWFSSTRFDEIVVREQLIADPGTKKTRYCPVELFLRDNSCVPGEPVVVLSFDMDVFYARSKATGNAAQEHVRKLLESHQLEHTVLSEAVR